MIHLLLYINAKKSHDTNLDAPDANLKKNYMYVSSVRVRPPKMEIRNINE
jgi:hypothetical protein